jgi:VWFA-related protein
MKHLMAAVTGIAMMLGGSPQQTSAPASPPPVPQTSDTQGTAAQQTPGGYTLSVNANIVLTNVVVRDRKTGALIKDLKASDFQILENGKPQKIASFDYENVDEAATLAEKTVTGKASVADLIERSFGSDPARLKDHRLIVIFFDLSSMQDEDIDRAVDAAKKYVTEKMQPADLVAMVSMSTGLSLDQDFTSDKTALLRVLAAYNGDDTTGFTNGGTGTTDGTSDDTTAFAADDTEYNSLNTDRELLAIRSIAKSLEHVDQRKSMLYFSGGLTRNGIENQASLRAATNEAAKANLAIYSVDSRGLQAMPPGGDASKGSLRGSSAYSGSAITAQFNANFSSQETLATLSSDTGGKAFFDSNDFAPAFQQVQNDTAAYYILGFKSSDQRQDGAYRHLTVKVNRPDVKLEYRPGYYAPADFHHQKTEDREIALQEQLRSDVPATDVALYLQALYFRANDNRNGELFVPVSLIVPGSQIPFAKVKDLDKASLDIMGTVRRPVGKNADVCAINTSDDEHNFVSVGNVRDTVKLSVNQSQQVERKNIQYSTGFTLAPGCYQLKFVVRENQTGATGSFETLINVPDMKKAPIKLSSVVLASQRTQSKDKNSANPLDRDGVQWVPNVAHVFRQDQHLYLLYEVYDPTREKGAPAAAPSPGLGRREDGPVRVLTSMELLSGGLKVYETPVVTATSLNEPQRGAVAFQFDVPLTDLKPGTYVCQINVIDDAGGSFTFPRVAVRVLPPAAATPAPTTTASVNTPATTTH